MTQVADKPTSSVRETMRVTKEALDPSVHAARHPWVFVGGALVLGYAVGTLARRGWRLTTGVVPYYLPSAKGAAVIPTNGAPSSERRESGVYPFYPHRAANHGRGEPGQADRRTVWAELERALHDELGVGRKGVGKGCVAIPQEVGGLTYKRGIALFAAKAHDGTSRKEGCPESSFSERKHLAP
ncbi:MAG: hypothetical protein ABIQ24_07900 [Nitrospiraceae bacterium]